MFDRYSAIRIITDICLGMEHLHALGIAHTDLSLTNLLYAQGRAKVADLGCSYCSETWVLPRSEKGTPKFGLQPATFGLQPAVFDLSVRT